MCAVLVYGVSFWLFERLLLLLFADAVLGLMLWVFVWVLGL